MTDAELIARLNKVQWSVVGESIADGNVDEICAQIAAGRIEEYARAFANLQREYDKRGNLLEVALHEIARIVPKHPAGEIARGALQRAALDELARLGQDFDANAGASVIRGLCEAIVSRRDTGEATP